MTSYLLLFSCLATSSPVATGLSQQPAQAGPPTACRLPGGLRVQVHGTDIVITTGTGAVVARNSQLIRKEDETPSCPSAGFERIVAKGCYFTIEQQTCGGWSFIQEYSTFCYAQASGKIVLYKYERVTTDRRDPNKVMPTKLYTAKQFGQRPFIQVTKASLDAIE